MGGGALQTPRWDKGLLLLRTRPQDMGSAGLVVTGLHLCVCGRVTWDRWDSLPGGWVAGRAQTLA